jgi:hypothetical protein
VEGDDTRTDVLQLVARVGQRLGRPVVAHRAVSGGYSAAARLVITFDDGSSAFIKAATDERTADALRSEHAVYVAIRADFMPGVIAWDDGPRPVLALEDLSQATWPAPWTDVRVRCVLAMLERVAATAPPSFVPDLAGHRTALSGWYRVAADPEPFLALRLCSPRWLDEVIERLVDAESRAPLAGDALLHLDVRSDNMCTLGDRTILVDWGAACRGNPEVDRAFWAPSLHMEGGPPPRDLLPDARDLAALVSGFFAARAGLPVDGDPRIRALQLAQLRVAFPWAVEALGL